VRQAALRLVASNASWVKWRRQMFGAQLYEYGYQRGGQINEDEVTNDDAARGKFQKQPKVWRSILICRLSAGRSRGI
jgi:hypothetical protein